MKVIEGRNVHCIFPEAVAHLNMWGCHSESRNGPVLVAPWPVTTVYRNPMERVLFWPERDANPFLHLYESLWMLSGRNDLAPLLKFSQQFGAYSDDGKTLHDAYGYRWRNMFAFDQLRPIINRLKTFEDDRRCVLQMWHTNLDLGNDGKAVPCNLIATFQRGLNGELNLTVFNRSNDIIWGCYGANAVHFSMLLEYMALKIGCPVGKYTQISINWHAYLAIWPKVRDLAEQKIFDPYEAVDILPMPENVDWIIEEILENIDTDFQLLYRKTASNSRWFGMIFDVLYAHHLFKNKAAPEKYTAGIEMLTLSEYRDVDWVVAAREWLERRYLKWESKMTAI